MKKEEEARNKPREPDLLESIQKDPAWDMGQIRYKKKKGVIDVDDL